MLYYKHTSTHEVYAFETEEERSTFGPPELRPMTPEEVGAHLNPPIPIEQQLRIYIDAIQKRLDDFARTRGYDSILSACTYATSTNQQFAAEGQRCVELRDLTWTAGYAILADVEAGTRPIPTVEQVMAECPALTWEDA